MNDSGSDHVKTLLGKERVVIIDHSTVLNHSLSSLPARFEILTIVPCGMSAFPLPAAVIEYGPLA